MMGVNARKLRGRQLFVPLVALLFTFVFLLAWVKNPFVTTLFSAQDYSGVSSLDVLSNSPKDQPVAAIPREHVQNVSSPLIANEEAEKDKIIQSLDARATNSMFEKSPDRNDSDVDMAPSSKREVCNYAKGRWVADSRRPLYSGFGCKQWLSGMWACRLTQRTDFSYEKYRWQPEICDMPEFQGSAFLRRMRNTTLAFVGDSLGRQQFQSLMCMISGGKRHQEVEDVGFKYGLVKAPGAKRPDGWAYRFPSTNTTILYYWSASLCGIDPINITDPATEFAMHLDRPPGFLTRFLHRINVLVLNTGHHWNREKLKGNKWVMHVNGKPLRDGNLAQIGNAKNLAIRSIVKWVDSQLPLHPQLKVFFRTMSPRHFFNGDWNSGGGCNNTTPLARGSEVSKDGSSDRTVENAVKGTRVRILDITAISELRDEGHISRYGVKATPNVQDCLHWCLPGIPDSWNELMFAQL